MVWRLTASIVLTISAAVVVYGSERLANPTFRLGGLALLVTGLGMFGVWRKRRQNSQ